VLTDYNTRNNIISVLFNIKHYMHKIYLSPVTIIISFTALFYLFCSCNTSGQDGNDYLYKFNDEVSAVKNQPEKVKALEKRELEKYRKSGNRLYLISSKYSHLFINFGIFPNAGEIPYIYELMCLNDDQYAYITIVCNFNLAYQFENISPEQSMQFLNKAIEADEKTGKMLLLPHLYHLKGKLYFNEKNYSKALIYFNKAMEGYIRRGRKDDTVYVASMYNNISMVYQKVNNIELGIKNAQKGIDILRKKKNLNQEEEYYIHYFSGNLATYFIEQQDYLKAEKLLAAELEFCKDREVYYKDAIASSRRLIDIYTITGEKQKHNAVINFLINLEPKIKSIHYKIATNEILQSYYLKMDDLQNLKMVSKRMESLQREQNSISEKKLHKVSDALYQYVLKKIYEEYDHKMDDNKKRNWFLLVLALFIVLFLIWLIWYTKKKNKTEKELLEQQKLLLEDNKKLLEKDVQLQKEKNKNLHLSLNLKIETEKALLENLKKIRRTKKTDVEESLKELQFKINNLIQIDNKNYDFMNESSLENKLFTEKLSHQFPCLTEQELNLCVYFKLNLSSKEVSLLEGITSGSVRVYKTKIKSKIGLGKEQKLDDFLNTI